tara:strand:- start:556 stop:1032 length:477 start_codon:yes stop_codon:yes gene_type:complete
MAKIKMGRVGDRTPPPGFVADLKAFDPDLKIKWSNQDEAWIVFQSVKRNRHCGEWNGSSLYEVASYDAPVLWVNDMREPDRRVLAQLYKQRALDEEQRKERLARRVQKQKEEQDKKLDTKFASAKEGIERGAYELRKRGVAGTVAPFYAPKGGWTKEG